MARYHINPATGDVGLCRARKNCPFGDFEHDHYATPEAARAAFEKEMKLQEAARGPSQELLDSDAHQLFTLWEYGADEEKPPPKIKVSLANRLRYGPVQNYDILPSPKRRLEAAMETIPTMEFLKVSASSSDAGNVVVSLELDYEVASQARYNEDTMVARNFIDLIEWPKHGKKVFGPDETAQATTYGGELKDQAASINRHYTDIREIAGAINSKSEFSRSLRRRLAQFTSYLPMGPSSYARSILRLNISQAGDVVVIQRRSVGAGESYIGEREQIFLPTQDLTPEDFLKVVKAQELKCFEETLQNAMAAHDQHIKDEIAQENKRQRQLDAKQTAEAIQAALVKD